MLEWLAFKGTGGHNVLGGRLVNMMRLSVFANGHPLKLAPILGDRGTIFLDNHIVKRCLPGP